jgi:glycosyltransferase involved in cell wall biosynthesis
MYDLTVVIATHNRPAMVIEAIESVLSQKFKEFYFILSDNSDNNDTFLQLENRRLLDKLYYVKRLSLSPMEHFNTILNEINTKYMILFHDDDIMLPDMVGVLYKEIVNDNEIIAVGCNAYLQKGNKTPIKSFGVKNTELLASKLNLIERYYDNSIALLPSYIYDLDLIKKNNVYFTDKAGKYSDVLWLLEIMNYGKIKWLINRLMIYRLHLGQDSAMVDISAKQRLVNCYSISLNSGKKNRVIKKHRILNLYYLMLSRLKRNNKMTLFLFRQLLFILKNQDCFLRKYLLRYCFYIVNIYFSKFTKINILSYLEKRRR